WRDCTSDVGSSDLPILAADDKAGLAIILEVLRTIKEKDLEVGDVETVISSGEEEGLLGAKHLDLSLLKADVAFVLDSDGPPGGVTTRAPSYDSSKSLIGRVSLSVWASLMPMGKFTAGIP
ncbi:M20/M25/M40 family metallo-hydrolase, partial [Candidatus Hakubella thermalkaliphila]